MIPKMIRMAMIIIFTIINIGIFAQETSSGNVYKDLRRNFDLKNAKFVIIVDNKHETVDTLTLSKINPDWLEKVNILKVDPTRKDSEISTVEIYIRKEYKKKTLKVIKVD
jgi:acyl-coenzyme A synthetase/AMP-(fatty) acid ligase